jgi:hypothetical protein
MAAGGEGDEAVLQRQEPPGTPLFCLYVAAFQGDAEKVRIAPRLRRETSVTQKWIARRLRMGNRIKAMESDDVEQ